MSGTIITFYSYKGGVGRSFALANVAVLLAKWGYRVLCIDWDVEAPGLDEYFRPWLGSGERPGLTEYVTAFRRGQAPSWSEHVNQVSLPGCRLDLITAGVPDDTFIERVQAIDWRALYDDHAFGADLERAREHWKDKYDLVLVDSRTGITDIGGICTVHLPDMLVCLFTANLQSLNGVVKVAQQAKLRRDKLPLNRAGLLTLPLLSRFDGRGQDEIAKQWSSRIADALEPFYDAWLDEAVSPRHALDLTRIPYFSVWTFGERLAVLEERESDPEKISYHFANIAALLAHQLGDTGQLATSRDVYVEAAKQLVYERQRANNNSGFVYDYFLSGSAELSDLTRQLGEQLVKRGYRVFTDRELSASGNIRETLEHGLEHSRELVVLAGARLSPFALAEIMSFQSLEGDQRKVTILERHGAALDVRSLPADARRRTLQADPASGARDLAALLLGEAPADANDSGAIDHTLEELAARYASVRIPEYGPRVAAKDYLALQLGTHVVEHRVSRDALASAPPNDGFIAALAQAAVMEPEKSDLDRLLHVGPHATMLHTAFQLLSTISQLMDRDKLTPSRREQVSQLLTTYEEKAKERSDTSLLVLVETTRRRIANYS